MTSNPKTRKKNLPKSTSEMSKETLIETLKKKRECNVKALAIVERLCEASSLNVEWFLASLEFINQTHFDDVIVERAILKLCGYPLCGNKLENVPSKKYHISTKQNKVFDITERKNFCSSICYKAAMYLKNQLLTSPLWFRDQEIIPKFKLLNSSAASMGEEVVFLPEKEKLKKEVMLQEKAEKNELCDMDVINKKLGNVKLCDEKEIKLKTDEKVVEENNAGITQEKNIVEVEEKNNETEVGRGCEQEIKENENKNNLCNENVAKCNPDRDCDKKLKSKTAKVLVNPVKKVEQCIYEWFTFDTVLYLYGEEKVKDLIKYRKDEIKDIIGRKPLIPGCNERIDRMIQFYSLLDQQAFDSESAMRNLKPLPDYSAIKEDGKKLEVKVRAFYSGELEMREVDVAERKKEGEDSEENEIYLPTIDSHAQNSLRVKILLDRFNRVIPELIRTFTTASCFDVSELRNLVNHFTLSAHNITFKPGEWYLIGFIVIKLLSVKNKQLESLIKSETGRKHITLFLMNYNLPEDYLENIVEWLVNAESLIRKLK